MLSLPVAAYCMHSTQKLKNLVQAHALKQMFAAVKAHAKMHVPAATNAQDQDAIAVALAANKPFKHLYCVIKPNK